ncbi:sugar kinase [Pseudoclavibacter sp. AY1F1]|uniref:sugar kinase n=1 Tax=Pseudoclavibacter sp. AY1F1 TaxID=2080583 RepID=UPI001CA37BA0|nr:sugar kinase [Pseudoclavibacter sp. AY1F1]
MSGIVTIGEALGLVLARRAGGFDLQSEAEMSFGGAESNVAIAAARLGAESAWIGRLGDDAIGNRIRRTLRAEQVQLHATIDPDAPTALMIKDRPRPGHSRVTYYRHGFAGSRITPADVPNAVVTSADVLHVTGISLALSDSAAETVLSAVRLARERGVTVSFDVNHRSKLWSAEQAAPRYRELVALSDIVFAGDDEAAMIVGGGTPLGQARALQALGPTQVLIKRGEHGASGVDGELELEVPAYRVDVVDTVGAGDAFAAGYLVELTRGGTLEQRLLTAAACGACACRSDGDWESQPSWGDVQGLVEGSGDAVLR